jgi:hypothetical protein
LGLAPQRNGIVDGTADGALEDYQLLGPTHEGSTRHTGPRREVLTPTRASPAMGFRGRILLGHCGAAVGPGGVIVGEPKVGRRTAGRGLPLLLLGEEQRERLAHGPSVLGTSGVRGFRRRRRVKLVVVGAQVGVGIGNVEAMATVKVARQGCGRVESCVVNSREEVQVVGAGVGVRVGGSNIDVDGVVAGVVDGGGVGGVGLTLRPPATTGPGSHFRP